MADRRPVTEIPTSSNQQVLLSHGMLQGFPSSCSTANFISRSTGLEAFKDHHEAYDLTELERALILNQEQDRSGLAERQGFGIRPPTLTIFPSWPMQFEASPKATTTQSLESTDTGSAQYKGDPQVELESANTVQVQEPQLFSDMAGNSTRTETSNEMDRDSKPEKNRRGPTSSSEHEASKTLDAKTLRRLAQNREAARKSRLRKKAYVQQLESSRMKLSQIEQDLQRARAQGLFIGGSLLNDQGYSGAGGLVNVPLSSGAAMFDMEYSRWVEEQHRHMSDLRAALQAHLPDNDLRLVLDNCLSHYDDVYRLKSIVAKTDVFHLVSGMWKTPAERCFMWMGGFRPSELLKILIPQLEPLTEQQFLGICNLQQSSQQAEDALSQGMEALQQSLSETIAAGSLSSPSNVANYMGQMAIAMGQLANLEGFVRQADNLRQQTLHQLHRLLTTRQAARCLLAIGEYFTRLRALSSLWSARPRERLLVDGSCSPATTTPSHDNYFSTS
ncbi:hypothetical protein SUGI_1194980 [Cryptomeria japonica]|uniref:transcription factor TGA2.2 isoform X2 n=2 Tax=Cryptomeria japonica TaxID=3369 RepID=UPI002414B1BB|nr:transcription factor TGA2.2 isoform X2 [Cryptomeria japonica]GLJ55639.1 hypothetical protein SUGI_1194980 [Cryptomeria japonica]